MLPRAPRSCSPAAPAPRASAFPPIRPAGSMGAALKDTALVVSFTTVLGALLWGAMLFATAPVRADGHTDGSATAELPAGRYLEREAVRRWIRETSEERGLDRHRVSGLFARLMPRQDILEAISTPAERTLTWAEYRPIFLGEERIRAGRAFLAEHAAALSRAEERFGVPARVIVAIIGVETLYGRITGRHEVLASLATLAFDYPPRAAFFGDELAEFLVLSEEEGWNALEIRGSYAGAMGLAQFISSSYRHYAIDFDGDGRRDLFGSPEDAIGSIGNYLAEHGWRAGERVAERWEPVGAEREAARALVRTPLEPTTAPETVRRLGFDSRAAPATPAGESTTEEGASGPLLSVMSFAASGGEELWIGYTNFYAITRYNHSRLYALAVHQLAEAIGEVS